MEEFQNGEIHKEIVKTYIHNVNFSFGENYFGFLKMTHLKHLFKTPFFAASRTYPDTINNFGQFWSIDHSNWKFSSTSRLRRKMYTFHYNEKVVND